MSRTPQNKLFQFGSSSEGLQQNSKKARATDFFSPLRFSRFSTQIQHPTIEKGKRRGDIYDNLVTISRSGNDMDAYHPIPSHIAPVPRPTSANTAKKRASVLIAASDALGLKFSRKKPTIPARLPPSTALFPEIIEIVAHTQDAESEERERLREEAAQCLGISMDQEVHSINLTEEEEGELEIDMIASHVGCSDDGGRDYARGGFSNLSSESLPSPPRPDTFTSSRSGSIIAHNRRPSNLAPQIPPFPASIDALEDFKQLVALFPKYYPSTSLRIFALSKNWKVRYLILTSPPTLVTGSSDPAVSYLHVFKSSAAGEMETERLEINEDSVVYIAEEDVGGRKHVVKVGGRDEGGVGKDQLVEESGRTMWFFQMSDATESQKWISTIKNVILGQRTIRAGLVLPSYTVGGIEPRGDMDVMLSIRQQGIITASSTLRQSTSSPQSIIPDGNYASSVSSHSLRSQATAPRTPTSASGLRSFFTSRPRATSRAISFESEREGESYTSMSHLLSKLRPGSAESKRSSEGSFVPPLSSFTSNTLQRKIFREHTGDSSSEIAGNQGGTKDRAIPLTSLSLQPPPRKRRASGTMTISTTSTFPDLITELTPVQDVQFSDEPPSSPGCNQFDSSLQRSRVPSVQSVSTVASTDNTASQERSSISTQRSTKRWSRQSILPARSSPPNGPPPAPPPNVHLLPHPYAAELSMIPTSSNRSTDKTTTSGFTSFSAKRASTASGFSVKSVGTTQSFIAVQSRPSRPSSAHRTSMPPPSKPAPTAALPPAPEQGSTSPPPSRPSFRESVAVRVGRLSTMVPKPVHSASLPSQPGEKYIKSHRRASSGSYFIKLTNPNPSTSSLTFFPSHSDLPVSRPIRPLPPTPNVARAPAASSRPAQWEGALKRRLRMLSAPSIPTITKSAENSPPDIFSYPDTVTASIVRTHKLAAATMISQSTTPIAEKITSFQNDPNFLQFDTLTISTPRPLPPTPDQMPEMTSLSPPPRRYSRQVSQREVPSSEVSALKSNPNPPTVEGEHRLISLSRPSSAVSLGILRM